MDAISFHEIAYYRGKAASTGTPNRAMVVEGMAQEEASRFIETNGVP